MLVRKTVKNTPNPKLMLTVDNNFIRGTSDVEFDATSTFSVVNATQCRHVLLTTLVNVHLTR